MDTLSPVEDTAPVAAISKSVPFTDLLVVWLTAHPGFHRPIEVAHALGANRNVTASRLIYLASAGRIKRKKSSEVRNGPGSSVYSA